MLRGRPHASWLRQVESYLKDAGMAGLASAWVMARRRPREVDAATRCSGVCPHTWPDYAWSEHFTYLLMCLPMVQPMGRGICSRFSEVRYRSRILHVKQIHVLQWYTYHLSCIRMKQSWMVLQSPWCIVTFCGLGSDLLMVKQASPELGAWGTLQQPVPINGCRNFFPCHFRLAGATATDDSGGVKYTSTTVDGWWNCFLHPPPPHFWPAREGEQCTDFETLYMWPK